MLNNLSWQRIFLHHVPNYRSEKVVFQSKDSLSVCAPSISSFSFSVPLFRIDAEEEVPLSRSGDWEGVRKVLMMRWIVCVRRTTLTYVWELNRLQVMFYIISYAKYLCIIQIIFFLAAIRIQLSYIIRSSGPIVIQIKKYNAESYHNSAIKGKYINQSESRYRKKNSHKIKQVIK